MSQLDPSKAEVVESFLDEVTDALFEIADAHGVHPLNALLMVFQNTGMILGQYDPGAAANIGHTVVERLMGRMTAEEGIPIVKQAIDRLYEAASDPDQPNPSTTIH